MWTPETKQQFLQEKLALWRPGGGIWRPPHLTQVARGFLWSVSLNNERKVSSVQRLALDKAEQRLSVPWEHDETLLPVAEVPEGHGERLRAAAAQVEALRRGYEAGEQWVPLTYATIGTHPVLGSVYVSRSSGDLSSRPHPFDDLFGWSWEHPDRLPGPLAGAEGERVRAQLEAVASLIEGARGGALVISFGMRPGEPLFCRGGRFFWLRDVDQAGVDRLLFNPWASALSLEKVLDLIGRQQQRSLEPPPPVLAASLERLDEELRRPKSEIVDRYLARLRSGGTISGGPTTDQSWTIRAAGGGFVIEGYRPTNDGGHERSCDPISEENVRAMIGSYMAFGLGDD